MLLNFGRESNQQSVGSRRIWGGAVSLTFDYQHNVFRRGVANSVIDYTQEAAKIISGDATYLQKRRSVFVVRSRSPGVEISKIGPLPRNRIFFQWISFHCAG